MSARTRPLLAPAVATLIGIAILVGLGMWQLKRLAWKEALISAVDSRAGGPPVAPPARADWPRLDPATYEYRHVRLEGVYDLAHQALVFRSLESPRGRYGGTGYLVMTPLRLADGSSVIVNRGFVPDEMKTAASEGPSGPTVVTGLMRSSEARTWFTPADDPARGVWFTRDVDAIAAGLNAGAHAPFSIDADAGPAPLPQGGETILSFPNNHFSYAMTWFGMALALAGVFAAYAMPLSRKPLEQGRM